MKSMRVKLPASGKSGFLILCRAHNLPDPLVEHKFHDKRKWRFDFCWPSDMLALEIEGGAWIGGRHTSGAGFVADMEKYNAAVMLGWRLLRCTPADVSSGRIFETLKLALAG